jgi:hypothetical protein
VSFYCPPQDGAIVILNLNLLSTCSTEYHCSAVFDSVLRRVCLADVMVVGNVSVFFYDVAGLRSRP